MPENVADLITRIALEEGVDPALALAVARQESGLNPKAYNGKGESSVGLFQLNQNGGMGSGYDRATLEDPEFNARIAIKALARTQKANPNLSGGQLAAASQRPADQPGYARSINAMLSGGQGQAHQGSPFDPGAVTMGPMQGDRTVADTPIATRNQERTAEAKRELETWQNNLANAERNLAQLNNPVDADGKPIDISTIDPKALDSQRRELEARATQARQELTRWQKELTDAGNDLAQSQTGARIINPSQSEPYLLDAQGNVIGPNPNYKAEDPSLIGQRNASADASAAQAQRTRALLPGEVAYQTAQTQSMTAQAAVSQFTLAQKQAEQQALSKLQELIAQGVDPQKAVAQVAPDYATYVRAIGDQLSNQLAQQRQAEEARHNQSQEQYQQQTLAETTRAHDQEEASRQQGLDQSAATAAVNIGQQTKKGILDLLPSYRTSGFTQDLGNIANSMLASTPQNPRGTGATFNPANFTPAPGELPNPDHEMELATAQALAHISPAAAARLGQPLNFIDPAQALAQAPKYQYQGA